MKANIDTEPTETLWEKIMFLPSKITLIWAFAILSIITWNPWRRKTQKPKVVAFERACHFSPDASIPDELDVLIIGSGPGACTCANLLAQMGRKVLVLEQHPTSTGGGTHSFRSDGCEWDTGLHYTSYAMSQKTTRPGAIMDFMTKGKQEFQPFPEPYDELVFPDHASYPFMNGKKKTIQTLLDKLDMSDLDSLELKRRVETYMGIYEDVHQGFVALGLSRVLPKFLHWTVRPRVKTLLQYAALTVQDVQFAVFNLGYSKDDVLKNSLQVPAAAQGTELHQAVRRLKAILAHPIGDYGVQPREASFAAHGVTAQHYIDGGSYTVGPTQNISIRLTSVVRACGGDVLVDATVRDIIVENGRAVGVRVSKTTDLQEMGPEAAPTTEIRAKRVVCGTSVYNLYNKLLPQDMQSVKQFQDTKERSIRQSNGHLFAFLKLKGDPGELELPDHNIWYFHGDDLDEAYDKFYTNPRLNRPPIVYLGFPCTKDRTWKKRFPGVSNCIIISDGLYEWFEQWAKRPVHERGEDYDALKESLTTKLLEILYEFVPQVIGKVEFVHLATPLTEESWLGSYRGGAYTTLCTPDMFTEKNLKWTSPHTEVPGLYVAGASAFFPGLTGAMYGGCLAACAVLGYFGTAQLGYRILSHLAQRLRESNPKLTYCQAYRNAIRKFVDE
jgi:all-trans-retinol 13,14-reductase